MKFEKYLFYVTSMSGGGYLIDDWEGSEYTPVVVNCTTKPEYFLSPVKLMLRRKNWAAHGELVAVRTDAYPLLWVYVWLYLQLEWLNNSFWCDFMRIANRVGIAKTPRGEGVRLIHQNSLLPSKNVNE